LPAAATVSGKRPADFLAALISNDKLGSFGNFKIPPVVAMRLDDSPDAFSQLVESVKERIAATMIEDQQMDIFSEGAINICTAPIGIFDAHDIARRAGNRMTPKYLLDHRALKCRDFTIPEADQKNIKPHDLF
jgi:hypothetical protein